MTEFLFLMRGADWGRALPPRECQDELERMMAWVEEMRVAGKLTGGQPLTPTGRIVSSPRTRNVTDGPFVESKEEVGGYLLIEANTMEEAVDLAKACPVLQHGLRIEVRPIVAQCPLADDLGVDENAG